MTCPVQRSWAACRKASIPLMSQRSMTSVLGMFSCHLMWAICGYTTYVNTKIPTAVKTVIYLKHGPLFDVPKIDGFVSVPDAGV